MSTSGVALPARDARSLRRAPCLLCFAAVFYAVVALLPLARQVSYSLGITGTIPGVGAGPSLEAYRSWGVIYFGCAALCSVLLFRRSAVAVLPAAVVTSWFVVGVASHVPDWWRAAGFGEHAVRGGIWCGIYVGVFGLVLWLRKQGTIT